MSESYHLQAYKVLKLNKIGISFVKIDVIDPKTIQG